MDVTRTLARYVVEAKLEDAPSPVKQETVRSLVNRVPSVDLALSRVRARVSEGGHNVPEAVVRRRFRRSIRNFFIHYRRLADSWSLFDNSGATPIVIAFEKQGEAHIMEREIYNALVARYGET